MTAELSDVEHLLYTPVRPSRSRGRVHAVTAAQAGTTVCDLEAGGWVVATTARLTCRRCIAAIGLPVDPGTRERAR